MAALKKILRLGIVTFSILILLPISVFASEDTVRRLKEKPLKIDFSEVVQANAIQLGNDSLPPLKIAVAAMISPQYTYKYYVDLLNLIGERMGRKVVFVQKKTYTEVNQMFCQKKLDLAFICSGPYVAGREDFGMEILAVPVSRGEKVYYSYYITSIKSGIKSFDELRGKTFAFTDPLSNSGYMVPVFYLYQRNETPERYFKNTFFTHSHDNSIKAVADGLADGAAVDSLIYDFMQARNPAITAKTIIIEKSSPYGIPPVVVTSTMEPEEKEKLQKLFLSIHEDPEGKMILKNLEIDRFVEGNDDDYKTVLKLQEFLNSRRLRE